MLPRLYEDLIADHLHSHRQMVFLMGPRQVGKTTSARRAVGAFEESHYLNWDNRDHRRILLGGPGAVAEHIETSRLRDHTPVLLLDEIHKWGNWKDFLKGLFDTYVDERDKISIVVTGSARLDVFRSGGDSLMGRYFGYRMHPLSIAELARPEARTDALIAPPNDIPDQAYDTLRTFGGFPEPHEKADDQFYGKWRKTRSQLLFKEDLRDLSRIRELGQVEILAELLVDRVGSTLVYSNLARDLDASVNTIKQWLQTLSQLYYCFPIRPWHKNVSRALRKRPKYYLWDWSLTDDPGARAENLVASALLKAVHYWNDQGLIDFDLRYIRDKQKNEVDFAVIRDDAVWFLVEVKSSDTSLTSSLSRFQSQTNAHHAFQVVMDLDYVDTTCFDHHDPTVVPARTFLSQLV